MKYVLITGATGGIGQALAKVFGKSGYGLILNGTNEKKLEKARKVLNKACGVPVYIFRQDLSMPGSAQKLYDMVKKEQLSVDILVNNAGFGLLGPAETINSEDDEKMMTLNMLSMATLCKLCLKEMYQKGGGKILNVSSTGAFVPGTYTASYYASKTFVLNYTKAIRYEAKQQNVQICALCPGTTRTGFFEKAGADTPVWAMDPMKVAEIAYRGLMNNKAVIIPGIVNQWMCRLPEAVKTAAIARIKKKTS